MRKKQQTKQRDEDACVTGIDDILSELSYWGQLGKFRGKRIICPCDCDIVEKEQIYRMTADYSDSGDLTGVSYLRYSHGMMEWEEVKLSGEDAMTFIRDRVECNFVRALTQNARRWGVKAVTASGYSPELDRGFRFQDVDYSQYDVCITNPPYSQQTQFMKCVVGNIDFIVLSPVINRLNSSVGVPLMLRKAYLGKNIHLSICFTQPNKVNSYKEKPVGYDWVTSFPDAQRERNESGWHTGIRYAPELYDTMENMPMKDGGHPIIVSINDMPDDYDGWMFAPSNILDRLNTDEYEFYGTHLTGYLNEHKEISPFEGALTEGMLRHNGRTMYPNFVIRRKRKSLTD